MLPFSNSSDHLTISYSGGNFTMIFKRLKSYFFAKQTNRHTPTNNCQTDATENNTTCATLSLPLCGW